MYPLAEHHSNLLLHYSGSAYKLGDSIEQEVQQVGFAGFFI